MLNAAFDNGDSLLIDDDREVLADTEQLIFHGHIITLTTEKEVLSYTPASHWEPEEVTLGEGRITNLHIGVDAAEIFNTLNCMGDEDNVGLSEFIFRQTGLEIDDATVIEED